MATEPIHGSDGRIEYAVDLDKRAGRLLPDGSIDLRERNSAVAVTNSQVGSLCALQQGRWAAMCVARCWLLTIGADAELAPGENVRLKEVSTDVQVQIGSEVRLVTERIAGFNGVLSVPKPPSSQQIESKSRIF